MKYTLSVSMINYNYSDFIGQAIEAILSQSRLPDEFIIIDDSSTDNSVKIIESLIKKCSFARLIKNKTRMGALRALNCAYNLTTKDYYHSISSDDFILPGFFEKTMSFIEKHDLDLCCSIPRFLKEDNTYYEGKTEKNNNCVFSPNELVAYMKKTHFWIAGHTTILRRDKILKNGGFDINLKQHCDFYLFHKIAFEGKSGFIAESLACLRCHAGSFSKNNNYKKLGKPVQLQLLRKVNSLNNNLKNSFKESRLLSHLHWPLIKIILKRPYYWNYFFYMKDDVKCIIKSVKMNKIEKFFWFLLKFFNFQIKRIKKLRDIIFEKLKIFM